MIYFSNSKKIFLLTICVVGFFLALPNFSNVSIPLFPKQTINLGLDLRGGSYLLLEVDTNSIKNDRSQSLLEDIRSTFRQNKIKYSGLKTYPFIDAISVFSPIGTSFLSMFLEKRRFILSFKLDFFKINKSLLLCFK